MDLHHECPTDQPRVDHATRFGAICHELAKAIGKYDVETGEELDRIVLPVDGPDPHGLTIRDGELWYSDAAFPAPSTRDYPEIGKIVDKEAT